MENTKNSVKLNVKRINCMETAHMRYGFGDNEQTSGINRNFCHSTWGLETYEILVYKNRARMRKWKCHENQMRIVTKS